MESSNKAYLIWPHGIPEASAMTGVFSSLATHCISETAGLRLPGLFTWLFLILQLETCQLWHRTQITILHTFSILKSVKDVASGVYIYKQPLIYVHSVHFNLWDREKNHRII